MKDDKGICLKNNSSNYGIWRHCFQVPFAMNIRQSSWDQVLSTCPWTLAKSSSSICKFYWGNLPHRGSQSISFMISEPIKVQIIYAETKIFAFQLNAGNYCRTDDVTSILHPKVLKTSCVISRTLLIKHLPLSAALDFHQNLLNPISRGEGQGIRQRKWKQS